MHRLSQLKLVLAASSLATAAAVAGAQAQTDVHRDAATRNVGGDAFMTQYSRAFYCNLPDDNNAIVVAARAWNNTTGANNNQYRIPLTQIFDDVWFVGNHYVGQYMIKTPDGFVQVDSGNNANEFKTFNYPALQSLGMSASYPLKAIFLTHGHGDHDGGAQWALDNLGTRSSIGSADATGKSYNPIQIDSTNLAMRQMTIGGKTFWILPTPGHTPGSTSAVLEVKDWGQTKRVLINGGQSMTNSIPQVAQYLDSIERTYTMATALNVDGVMTPHIYWDGEGVKLDEINAKGRTNPSQNIYGHESVMRQLAVARECSAAWLTRLDSTAVLPVWRFNTIEFVDGGPTPTKVAARVSNGWGPVNGQMVTFSVEETGANCTATTGADGVASCDVRPLRPHKDYLKAKFAGGQNASYVDLPAETSALVCSNGNCNAH
ncbi:MBL fold metallo-hydrolase [Variovorax sp. YR216]|uniref:MBL fold metallo-hydrolase n=1 Tax=Variovorax sp. YR216 TaxID=1882828 RepID=UPI000B81DF59|nr:MBL fold metallo-hydrolase [Variovorax sp. YR216]